MPSIYASPRGVRGARSLSQPLPRACGMRSPMRVESASLRLLVRLGRRQEFLRRSQARVEAAQQPGIGDSSTDDARVLDAPEKRDDASLDYHKAACFKMASSRVNDSRGRA